MKSILTRQVPLAWLLAVLVAAPALGIMFKLLVIDAPPAGVVITSSDEARATSAPVATTPSPTASDLLTSSQAVAPKDGSDNSQVASSPTAPSSPTLGQAETPTAVPVAVYVSGAVLQPGVYTLPANGRVADAVQMAGGMADDADRNAINLAAHLEDEEHIVVPRKGETPVTEVQPTRSKAAASPSAVSRAATAPPTAKAIPSQTQQAAKPAAQGEKININTASADELITLPGIGPALAAKIISYRSEHARFAATEDLMQVPGIKEGIYSKVRDLITVGP